MVGCLTGIALGCVAAGATEVADSMMLAAARAIGRKLTSDELQRDSVLPRIERLRCTRPHLSDQHMQRIHKPTSPPGHEELYFF